MPEPIRPSLFTLPFGQDLCEATVSAIFDRIGADPLTLSNALILLPNNRAIKSMTEAFVRKLKPGLLLPRMAALGDLALDEALGSLLDPLEVASSIPPAIEPMPRLFLLARLLTKRRAMSGNKITPTEALRLARNLANVIDELEIEKVQFERFDVIKPEGQDLAGHWQTSYTELLNLVPQYNLDMAAQGLIGPSARRNLLLERLAKSFAEQQHERWVIAAGVSTAAPAIAGLLRQVALLPQSMVILPAVDLAMPDADWDAIGPHERVEGDFNVRKAHESHPQYHLKHLLERMGFARGELEILGKAISGHEIVIPEIFCIPEATAGWLALEPAKKRLKNVRLMIADDSAQEALAISILIRKALEQEEKRVAVVTPDRELGLRVAAQLKRWGITVDDSAGVPLLQKPEAALVMALAELLAHDFAPVPLLTVLKHPLVHSGEGRVEWLEQVRNLDLLLRGPNEGIGLSAIGKRIANENNKAADERRILSAEVCTKLQDWWSETFKTFAGLQLVAKANLAAILTELQDVATKLSQSAVWKGTTGRQLAVFFEDIARYNLSDIGDPKAEAIPSVLSELLADQVVRPAYGGHPRVAIYGLLEARLQQADMVICGGLNEGSWPQLPQPDPWLAPRIRRDLGLPAPERNIGLAAHDLATALGAKEVILTRALRDRGGPTVASRFLLRIQALLGDELQKESEAIEFAVVIDKPDKPAPPYRRPAPVPSPDQRRVSVSITQFDTLKANPYSFYATKILGLSMLDAVDAEPSYAWRGTVIHRILELWHSDDDSEPAALIKHAEDLLSNSALHPALRAMWQPRIAESLRWIANETQRIRDEEGRILLIAEQQGKMEIAGVTVTGRADRIDRIADGSLAIVDYKTGGSPSAAQVSAGFALQLGMIGLMTERGAIEKVTGEASRFEYWSLAKDKGGFGAIKSPTSEKEKKNTILSSDLVAFAEKEAIKTLNAWINGDAAFTAMLEPKYAYSDHNQLMRLQEWDGREAPPAGEIS
jgi:ATP-dependent helicase/nuclease subunit B